MKFKANSFQLYRLLNIAESAVQRGKTMIPSLNNFHLILNGDNLQITGTDLQTTIVVNGDFAGIDDGELCVQAALISDILKRLGDIGVTVYTEQNNSSGEGEVSEILVIKTDTGEYKVPVGDIETFPTPTPLVPENSFSLDSGILNHAIEKLDFCMGGESERNYLRGMNCIISAEEVSFVATNALKLCRYTRKIDKNGADYSFIIPRKSVEILKKVLPKQMELKIEFDSKSITFSYPGVEITSNLIQSNFPDFTKAIPQVDMHSISADRLSLLNAIERLTPFSDESFNLLKFIIHDKALKLEAEDHKLSKNAYEEFDCEVDGADAVLPLQANTIMEACKRVNSDLVRFKYADAQTNILIEPVEEKDGAIHTFVLSPIKMSSDS